MEIITRLLERTPGARVTCVIRASDNAEADKRLAKVLHYASYWKPQLDFAGVDAVRGDITEARLGMASSTWNQLAKSVTYVIHSAASIELGGPREMTRRVNVEGTRMVASFAMQCPKIERFLPVSTAYVAGLRKERIHEEELDLGQGFVNHYERSKLESELFVRSLKDKLPITVVRPSIIVGDSHDGHVHSFQNIYIPMYFFGTGAVEELPGSRMVKIDIVPVDYVSDVVVETLHSRTCIGGTYHACSGPVKGVPLWELMRAARQSLGTISRRSKMPSAKALGKHLACFFDYLSHSRNFATDALQRDLASAAPSLPDPASFLPKLMHFWRATDFGRDMPWNRQTTLTARNPSGFGMSSPVALARQEGSA